MGLAIILGRPTNGEHKRNPPYDCGNYGNQLALLGLLNLNDKTIKFVDN